MATSSYATAVDVATSLAVTFTAAETAQADSLLRYVSAIMRKRVPGLETAISSGEIESDLAEGVCVSVVKQAITVKPGVKSEAHPEYTIVFQDAADAALDLTVSQIELLTPTADDAAHQRGKAFSVHPG